MYTITFYSFKGGTGRSMALINVAVEMVKSGLKVLVVDFDLEAPGLDTFKLAHPQKPIKGLIDCVLEYLESGQSPKVSEFIYETPIDDATGRLFVMSAGKSDAGYDHRFKSIDWKSLYNNQGGYLLFEDIKAQWNELISPDYVLIDSRTGHTDVSGICTRQLPDSVILFFFPNEQNRRGLESVVNQIRAESENSREKHIKLHFVMSNVPELDDEEGFLAESVAKIKETLKFDEISATIHHYQSLTLLTQSVFTLDRPKTRLAQEYCFLANVLRRDNIKDRKVALEFLNQLIYSQAKDLISKEIENKIQDIAALHSKDIEVLINLSLFLRQQRQFEEALVLLERVSELGANNSRVCLSKAELYSILGHSEKALKMASQLLEAKDATYLEISVLTRLLLHYYPKQLKEMLKNDSFIGFSQEKQFYVASELFCSYEWLGVAEAIFQNLLEQLNIDSDLKEQVSNDLILALIGQSKYVEAIQLISRGKTSFLDDFDINDFFNYAMATWGLLLEPPKELFQKIVDLDKKPDVQSANYHQCLSLALWGSGHFNKAVARLKKVEQLIKTRPMTEFSCWSYLKLSPNDFLNDLDDMEKLFKGELLKPRFIRHYR